jgi:hypothetical protein
MRDEAIAVAGCSAAGRSKVLISAKACTLKKTATAKVAVTRVTTSLRFIGCKHRLKVLFALKCPPVLAGARSFYIRIAKITLLAGPQRWRGGERTYNVYCY